MSKATKFPQSPYGIIHPDLRWYPERTEDFNDSRLVPLLVRELRRDVHAWRESNYEGASTTSKALLHWWFNRYDDEEDYEEDSFRYYFAQREAIETSIYLYEVRQVHRSTDFMKFESVCNSACPIKQFSEKWPRYVVKLATGTGKTKVLSMAIVWSYFHKLYEANSKMSKNFLLLCPNIIVMERLRTDFDDRRIFDEDPLLPYDGYEEQNWQADFDLAIHIQDDAKTDKSKGNLFLTNIHRVYSGDDKIASVEDTDTTEYFMGDTPKDAKKDGLDVGREVRELDELMVLNDEAHHIRDNQWAEVIQDLNNRLIQKGTSLSMQLDVSATPKDEEGFIFPQTICDYPLVEAIRQNVVKHPVVPDDESRDKCVEIDSLDYVEKYKNFLNLGVAEWRRTCNHYKPTKKQPILFVMVGHTKDCDKVGAYLEKKFRDLHGKVLVIHTNKEGEISEKPQGKTKRELDKLRKAANDLDKPESPYKAVVSVMVLKEGWDIKNVSTIVGLRAYSSKDGILQEQTLGRGLRIMSREYFLEKGEYLSVSGTRKFVEFVESLEVQGVEFDRIPMRVRDRTSRYGGGVSIYPAADRKHLDIEVPIISPNFSYDYSKIKEIDVANITNKTFPIKQFPKKDLEKYVFDHIFPNDPQNKTHHILVIEKGGYVDITSIIKWYVDIISKETGTLTIQYIIYLLLYEFITKHLFGKVIDVSDPNVKRSLNEVEIKDFIIELFIKVIREAIKKQTSRSEHEVQKWLKLSQMPPAHSQGKPVVKTKKSIFPVLSVDSSLEAEAIRLFDRCADIICHAKIYRKWDLRLEYENKEGKIKRYVPDFIVKENEKNIYIMEFKGAEYADDESKYRRLKEWCKRVNKAQKNYKYTPLYITQEKFELHSTSLKTFADLKKIATAK